MDLRFCITDWGRGNEAGAAPASEACHVARWEEQGAKEGGSGLHTAATG